MSVRILTGDCRDVLRSLPDESVNCCVTSPPYFGLRDYGSDGQIGLEDTPAEFIAHMVSVFREVRRVLRKDGTLWLNLGDSYKPVNRGENAKPRGSGPVSAVQASHLHSDLPTKRTQMQALKAAGFKEKDRLMIPARVAIALQEDGWYLRDEIVWHKPNPMPSSVTDRTTPSHEMLYMLSRSARYAYDCDAIKEPSVSKHASGNGYDRPEQLHRAGRGSREPWTPVRPQAVRAREIAAEKGLTDAHLAAIKAVGITDVGKAQTTQDGFGKNTAEMMRLAAKAKEALGGYYREFLIAETRNKRSVWTVPVMPFSEAHFATFPADLITDAIKAGCPVGGTVLDPFGGAGTTALVADRLGRDAILIELNPAYATMARDRLARDGGMFSSVAVE